VTPEEYVAMVAGKTGALLGAPLEIGAELAGVATETAARLGELGREVGLAFQVQDDYLGIWGDPGETGKSNTNDIARKKKTLPVVYGLGHPDAAAIISAAYAKPVLGPDEVSAVVAGLNEAGAREACREQARMHTTEAQRLLARLELTAEQAANFQAIAAYIIDRRS
jgi:geranylgeranyl diphosphate synthase type I